MKVDEAKMVGCFTLTRYTRYEAHHYIPLRESAEDMNETLTSGETNPDSSKPSAVQILKIARSNGCLFNSTRQH